MLRESFVTPPRPQLALLRRRLRGLGAALAISISALPAYAHGGGAVDLLGYAPLLVHGGTLFFLGILEGERSAKLRWISIYLSSVAVTVGLFFAMAHTLPDAASQFVLLPLLLYLLATVVLPIIATVGIMRSARRQ
jgi:hypothetical protein